MQQVTLLFLLKDDQILLAKKKRGVGAGKWNGAGGKVEPDESVEAAAIRECQEEFGIVAKDLEKVAELYFVMPSIGLDEQGIVYFSRSWEGEPQETEEMAPQWFDLDTIPFSEMWAADREWLPQLLAGEKVVARYSFNENEEPEQLEFRTVERFD